ncbi:MAG: cytidine deaminase [Bacteroidota bacterium]
MYIASPIGYFMDGFHFFSEFAELSAQDQDLIQRAREASKNSYSPYSQFRVGASARLNDGQVMSGSNQENASYPAGICAERVVLFHVNSSFPDKLVESIAVVARRADETKFKPVSPCGICRQVMLEVELKQNKPIRVILQSADGRWVVSKSTQYLLPFSFGQDSL